MRIHAFGLALLLSVLLFATASAQKTLQTVSRSETIAIETGFFAEAFVGPQLSFLGELEQDFLPTTALSTDSLDFKLRGTTTAYGVRAGGIYKKWVLRGQYGVQETTTSETLRGSTQLKNTGFGLHVGYLVYSQKRWLVFPYLGAEFATSELEVANFAPEAIQFGDAVIPLARTATYEASTTAITAGISARYTLSKNGGLYFGADLGGSFALGDSPWEAPEGGTEVANVSPHKLSAVSLRFVLGLAILRE